MIILFDLDGTLIDSTDAITSTFLHAFDKHKFNFNGTINDIIKEIIDNGTKIIELKVDYPSLNQIFLDINKEDER